MLATGCVQKVASVEESRNDDLTGNSQDTTLTPGDSLLVFWMFTDRIANNAALTEIKPVFPDESDAVITFISSLPGYPNTNRRASMERRNAPTSVNYFAAGNGGEAYNSAQMRGIQVKQPFRGENGENEMIFHLPTTGFSGIQFSIAAMDEGAARSLVFDYSIASGNPVWVTTGIAGQAGIQSLTTGEFQRYVLDFSAIPNANDNPDFKVRIRFHVTDGTEENGSRVTFNNVALHGRSIAS